MQASFKIIPAAYGNNAINIGQSSQGQSWGWGLKTPLVWPLFFNYFLTIQGKTKAQHFCDFCAEALQLIAINTPMRQASTCGLVLAQGRTPSAPKQWKSDVHVQS